MDSLINGLLLKNRRAVIPGFGTFILHESGITFDRSIAYDDGLLAEYISEQQHTGFQEAHARIGAYAVSLNETLENNGSVVIEGIGNIEKATDGSIRLLPPEAIAEGKTGLTEKDVHAEADKSAAPDDTVFTLDESESIDHAGSMTTTELPETGKDLPEYPDDPFVIDQAQDTGAGAGEIAPGMGAMNSAPVLEAAETTPGMGDTETAPGTEAPQLHSPEEARVAAETKPAQVVQRKRIPLFVKRGAAVAALILIILLVIRILPGGIFPELAHSEDSTVIKTVPEGQDGGPGAGNATTEDKTLSGNNLQPEDSRPLQAAVPAKNNYHVIAGCFGNIQNAENYVTLLKQHGYNARLIGVRKNLHVVSFDSFSRKQEALLFMNKIRQEFEPEAWVLYYRNP